MRTAEIKRKTKETDISVALDLDGGNVNVRTGIGFFDHMLTAFAVHGGFGLEVFVDGDLDVDTHHTVEDTGIALGAAFKKALGDMGGINRYGSFYIPMTKALRFVLLIFQTGLFLCLTRSLKRNAAANTKPAALRSFSVPLPLMRA